MPARTVSVAVFLAALSACAAITASDQAAIDHISADSLRGNLSFLASDSLEGRFTPSRGLDLASEYIAAQFRRAGLEPIGKNDSYFQTAELTEITNRDEGLRFRLKADADELDLPARDLQIRSAVALDLNDAALLELPESGKLPDIAGKMVIGTSRTYGTEAGLIRLQAAGPRLIVLAGRTAGLPEPPSYLRERNSLEAPVIRMVSEAAVEALGEHHRFLLSMHMLAPESKEVTARNVGGILRGSDPVLKDQYIFLTAHYDHLGKGGETIFNGANDNGSGTVSVIEIAAALSGMPVHPKRSIVFMTWYGEEEGLLGSYYYTHHPMVPLKDTVANINLEQMGRTDDEGGPEVGKFAFTGPSYSNLPAQFASAAKSEAVNTYRKKDADAFFDRSDNYAFALAGVVAHTIVVAFEYPDYHAPGDKWQKIDYANMAKVDKGVAAGLIEVANAADAPKWTESKATAVYRGAGK